MGLHDVDMHENGVLEFVHLTQHGYFYEVVG
jgi:hypothetical protein